MAADYLRTCGPMTVRKMVVESGAFRNHGRFNALLC